MESSTLVSALPAGVHRVALIERLEPRARGALRHAGPRPVLALQRIDAGGHVAVGEKKAERRLGREADIGIDEEEMGELRIGEEDGDAVVAAAGDEAVAPPQMKLEREAFRRAGPLEREDPERVVEADHAAIAGRGDERQKPLQSGPVEQGCGLPTSGACLAWRSALCKAPDLLTIGM